MIKVEKIDLWGFKHAVRGMRNPLNSWNKNDSGICNKEAGCGIPDTATVCQFIRDCDQHHNTGDFIIGPNDLDLMQRLYQAGPEHRKYLRQIVISMDITAPLYWWKEFDTYKVGTAANSCSTMHKIAAKEFEPIDFSIEHLEPESYAVFNTVLAGLNIARNNYLKSKNKIEWWQMIQLLPTSYNQMRTVTMNYENAITMIKQRTGHKLDEWNEFVEILKTLPYIKEITGWG